jgi:DNA replication initiation complex subunit (GINS family)
MRGAKIDPIKAENLERLKGRFRDILESRIGKITRLASAEVPSQTHTLEPDEVVLYKDLYERISEWRKAMKKMGEE